MYLGGDESCLVAFVQCFVAPNSLTAKYWLSYSSKYFGFSACCVHGTENLNRARTSWYRSLALPSRKVSEFWVDKKLDKLHQSDGTDTARRLLPCRAWLLYQFAAIAADTYPDVYDEFISKLTFINVNIGFFVSSSCVVRTNFHHRLLFATLTPLGVLLVLRVTYHIAKKRNDGCQRALLAVKHKHLSAALFIAFFIYSAVSFTIFQTFVCDTLDDGVRYLRADYSLTCSGARHKHYVVFSGLMVLLYPLGIPLICMWWVNEHQDELRRVDRDTIVALKPFQSIWAAYKPRRYFFEIVEFGRRLTLTVAAVFVSPGSSAQIAIVLLLAVVFLFVSESLSPFSRSSDMGLYRWGNGIVLGSMYVALLLKFDVSEEESGPLSAFAGVLVAANVFMVITVIVQSYFMVKEWRKADKSIEAPDPVASSGISGSTSCRRNEVGECSPAAADGSAEPGKEW